MWQRHYFLLVAIRVVFVFKNDITVIYVQYPAGGDGYLVRIAAEVFYYLRRAAKWGIGIYIPFLLPYCGKYLFYCCQACILQTSVGYIFAYLV